jgi:uncharacterized membrane protein
MGKNRLEAISNGVIAIIAIVVLELKIPHGAGFDVPTPSSAASAPTC